MSEPTSEAQSSNSPGENEVVKGEGFTMEVNPFSNSSPSGPGLEFRTGETNETARERREKLLNDYREKEANMTLEEKAKRAEEWERQNRMWMANWFETAMKGTGEYSEALQINQDGSLNREKRVNGELPFIVNAGNLKSPEDLFQLMQKVSQEHPSLDISFEVDENGRWIKYRVGEKAKAD